MTTFAGLLSKGAVLSYKDGQTTKEIAAVKSIPAMGSDPEKVDVTHLGSEKKPILQGFKILIIWNLQLFIKGITLKMLMPW